MQYKVFTEVHEIFPWYTGEFPQTQKNLKFVLIPIHPHLEKLYPFDTNTIVSNDQFIKELGIEKELINNLCKDESFYLILNNTHEGYSQKKYNIFDHIINFALEYNIPDNKILYFTSNIIEEDEYSKYNSKYKFKVFSFNVFEQHNYTDKELGSFDDTVYRIRNLNESDLKNWLCLNRIKRTLRTSVCYLIWKSQIYKDCKISYDSFTVEDIKNSFLDCFNRELIDDDVYEFIKTSPKVLDRKDFHINWAMEEMPYDLFNSTCISIINETVEPFINSKHYINNMLFYSEKTFKVIEFGQPLIIVGYRGHNTLLEKIGYKKYDAYFDLSFDSIEDNYDRIQMQIEMLENLNEDLNIMTHKEKIYWLLKDVETIHYNKVKKYRSSFNKKIIDRVVSFFNRK